MIFGAKAFQRAAFLATAVVASGVMLTSFCTSATYAGSASKAGKSAENSNPIVVLETTRGVIKIQVFPKDAPITSNNFLDLVGRKFYDGLTFHRYVDGFVIQGGDPTGTGGGNFIDPKTKKERHIKLEKSPKLNHNYAGAVAMARTNDPDSASCQFYITLAPAPNLDDPPGYAVFGKVIDGMKNVLALRQGDKMKKVYLQQ